MGVEIAQEISSVKTMAAVSTATPKIPGFIRSPSSIGAVDRQRDGEGQHYHHAQYEYVPFVAVILKASYEQAEGRNDGYGEAAHLIAYQRYGCAQYQP